MALELSHFLAEELETEYDRIPGQPVSSGEARELLSIVPGLHISDYGAIGLPVNDKALAHLRPCFTQYSQNNSLSSFYFTNPKWHLAINLLANRAAGALGIWKGVESIATCLMLGDETGHFLCANAIQENQENLCARLLVYLPSIAKGGEIILVSDEKLVYHDTSTEINQNFSHSTFFTIYYSELQLVRKPVISGARLMVMYNVYFRGEHTPVPRLDDVLVKDPLENIFTGILKKQDTLIPLRNIYTSTMVEKQGLRALKGRDKKFVERLANVRNSLPKRDKFRLLLMCRENLVSRVFDLEGTQYAGTFDCPTNYEEQEISSFLVITSETTKLMNRLQIGELTKCLEDLDYFVKSERWCSGKKEKIKQTKKLLEAAKNEFLSCHIPVIMNILETLGAVEIARNFFLCGAKDESNWIEHLTDKFLLLVQPWSFPEANKKIETLISSCLTHVDMNKALRFITNIVPQSDQAWLCANHWISESLGSPKLVEAIVPDRSPNNLTQRIQIHRDNDPALARRKLMVNWLDNFLSSVVRFDQIASLSMNQILEIIQLCKYKHNAVEPFLDTICNFHEVDNIREAVLTGVSDCLNVLKSLNSRSLNSSLHSVEKNFFDSSKSFQLLKTAIYRRGDDQFFVRLLNHYKECAKQNPLFVTEFFEFVENNSFLSHDPSAKKLISMFTQSAKELSNSWGMADARALEGNNLDLTSPTSTIEGVDSLYPPPPLMETESVPPTAIRAPAGRQVNPAVVAMLVPISDHVHKAMALSKMPRGPYQSQPQHLQSHGKRRPFPNFIEQPRPKVPKPNIS